MIQDWISGFICGEGCFTFSGRASIFTITLNIYDLNLLQLLKEYIGKGQIYVHKKQGSCTYTVRGKDNYKVIELLDGNLLGVKHEDFNIWKEMIFKLDKPKSKVSLDEINKIKPRFRKRDKCNLVVQDIAIMGDTVNK